MMCKDVLSWYSCVWFYHVHVYRCVARNPFIKRKCDTGYARYTRFNTASRIHLAQS